MSVVYEAEHEATGRPVAVKVLKPESLGRADRVRRFAREARMSARLHHPNIVSVLDFGSTAAGEPFLVLELARGRALSDLALPVSVPRTARIGLQVLGALESAHALGIVHRDLKAGNIIRLEGPGITDDFVQVLDFGLAKELDPDETASVTDTGHLLGTPICMSPEAISGDVITPAADFYALGVLLHQLATGRPPFEGGAGSLLVKHLNDLPPLLETPEGAPPEFVRLVMELLAKDPNKRPGSARVREVLAAVAGLPNEALASMSVPSTSGRTPSSPSLKTRSSASSDTAWHSPPATSPRRLGVHVAFLLAAAFLLVVFLTLVAVRRGGPLVAAVDDSAPVRADELASARRSRRSPETTYSVRVVSEPPGGGVWTGGEFAGLTPVDVSLRPGVPTTIDVVHPRLGARRLVLEGPSGPVLVDFSVAGQPATSDSGPAPAGAPPPEMLPTSPAAHASSDRPGVRARPRVAVPAGPAQETPMPFVPLAPTP